jgi:hypothetical protein
MTAESHPDPFQDAIGHGLQRAIQVTSCAVTAAQVYAYQQRTQAMAVAERDERTRRALATQMRADRDAARATWAPAVNPDWLRDADLLQTARTWAAAMPYADRSVPWYEPAAATAMRRCEDRLRDLHPYAMGRYDRLREDGAAPADAMRDAAPLFANAPRAYDRPYVPRPALAAGNGDGLAWTAAPQPREQTGVADAQQVRGKQIIAALQEQARAHHRGPLGEAEQRTVLETITNLPPDVIDHVVSPASSAVSNRADASRPALASTSATVHHGPADRPWKHDFPVPIQDVVATALSPASRQATAAEQPTQRRTRGGRHRR